MLMGFNTAPLITANVAIVTPSTTAIVATVTTDWRAVIQARRSAGLSEARPIGAF
jgi:hypothetical protein